MGKERARELLIRDFAKVMGLSEEESRSIADSCSEKAMRLALVDMKLLKSVSLVGWRRHRDEILARYGLVVPEGAADE